MSRTHHSYSPIEVVLPAQQDRRVRTVLGKPLGLWYSVDGSWEEWCADNMPKWIAGKIVYDVELGDERILALRTIDEILAFDAEYARAVFGCDFLTFPEWQRVAEDYDGIEIAPYCWELRLDLHWYYSWDCASGCIWTPRGVRLTRRDIPQPLTTGD